MTFIVDRVDDVDFDDVIGLIEDLDLGPDELRHVIDGLPPDMVNKLWEYFKPKVDNTRDAPLNPLLQAQELDPAYRERAHLKYLSDRLSQAVADVEGGKSRMIVVSMPPRMGKSQMCSVEAPVWILRKHPEWKMGLISHSPNLAVGWGRKVRNRIKENMDLLGISIAKDSGAVTEWETPEGGGVVSRSIRESITGLGFKVFIIDDAVKDFADAHSATMRDALWDWWLANAQTRLEGPYLVIVIGTRWHEDDIIGRLLSDEYEGDPIDWERIEFPAIAEDHDVLGRAPGEPLLSPIIEETNEEALSRWATIKKNVGTYTWSALYQQRPAPSKGAIFDTDWWRFWTTKEQLCSKDDDGNPDPKGKIVLLDPGKDLRQARWVDSWDMAFKATDDSDFVVGQRWAMKYATRYLIRQFRGRLTFTKTLSKMKDWASIEPYHEHVHERLVEDKANGTAVIDMLQEKLSGIIPVNPTDSKEGRARAVTPECEAGNVVLPLPQEPGHEWVADLLSELRDFPSGAHDDQTDALTQFLNRVRTPMRSSVTVPGRRRTLPSKTRGQVALAQTNQIRR